MDYITHIVRIQKNIGIINKMKNINKSCMYLLRYRIKFFVIQIKIV